MLVTYSIVHIHPDKTEEVIKTVKNERDIPYITEQPKYLGTWIRQDRKLLRWARGELVIRRVEHPTQIAGQHRVEYIGHMPMYELTVLNGDNLKSIVLNEQTIVGRDWRKEPLWQTNSFTKLAELVDKEVAYQVYQYYEKYLAQYKVKGII